MQLSALLIICFAFSATGTKDASSPKVPPNDGDCTCVALIHCVCNNNHPKFDLSDFMSRDQEESSDTGMFMICIIVS